VHRELGELWEKARRIVARLTEERLQREGKQMEDCERDDGIRSPGEDAVKKEAASWASERHHRPGDPAEAAAASRRGYVEDIFPGFVSAAARKIMARINGGGDGNGNHQQSSSGSDSDAAEQQPEVEDRSRRKFRIVHASVGLIGYGCPPEMIRLAISIHPNQVREMDEDGNLPLHIAVRASSYLATADRASPAACAAAAAALAANADAASVSDDLSVMSDAAMSFFSAATIAQSTHPFDQVIKILLQHHPEGAKVPQGRSGQLPLVLAVEPEVYPNLLALVASGNPEGWCTLPRPLLRSVHVTTMTTTTEGPQRPLPLNQTRVAEEDGQQVPAATSSVSPSATILFPLPPPRSIGLGGVAPAVPRGTAAAAATAASRGVGWPVGSSRSKKLRQDACARTTLFELVRSKPEWLTPEGRELDKATSM
jgi:hypothetical protein